jgi:hypothetical protein
MRQSEFQPVPRVTAARVGYTAVTRVFGGDESFAIIGR